MSSSCDRKVLANALPRMMVALLVALGVFLSTSPSRRDRSREVSLYIQLLGGVIHYNILTYKHIITYIHILYILQHDINIYFDVEYYHLINEHLYIYIYKHLLIGYSSIKKKKRIHSCVFTMNNILCEKWVL